VFDVFKKWLAQVENETCLKLKRLKSDNRVNTAIADSRRSVLIEKSKELRLFQKILIIMGWPSA